MADKSRRDSQPPTYQDAQNEVEELAGCIRFELVLYFIAGPIIVLVLLLLLR